VGLRLILGDLRASELRLLEDTWNQRRTSGGRGVFFVSSYVDEYEPELRRAQAWGRFEQIFLYSSLSEEAHPEERAYARLELLLQRDLQPRAAQVRVQCLPLVASCVLEDGSLFVIPAAPRAFPEASDREDGLSEDAKYAYGLVMQSLASLLEGVKTSVYAVGPASRCIGRALQHRLGPPGTAPAVALVLVDRELDLAAPFAADGTSLGDALFAALPGPQPDPLGLPDARLERVPLPALALLHPSDAEAQRVLRALIFAPAPRALETCLRALPPPATTPQSPSSPLVALEAALEAAWSDAATRTSRAGLLQVAECARRALREQAPALATRAALRRRLLSLVEEAPSDAGPFALLAHEVASSDEDELLGHLTWLYAACGPDALNWELPEALRLRLTPRRIERAREASRARLAMSPRFRRLVRPAEPYRPLIARLIEAALDALNREEEPAELFSCATEPAGAGGGGGAGVLSLGFGFARRLAGSGAAAARPAALAHHPTLMVLFIGGVTCLEAQSLRDVLDSRRCTAQLLVGGTCLARPQHILGMLYKQTANQP
jgi:hypothetical protein